MENYLDLIEKCCKEGIDVFNERTKKMCKVLVGAQLEFDLSNGDFPAVTTKKLAFKTMMGELLGFFRGYDNAFIRSESKSSTPRWETVINQCSYLPQERHSRATTQAWC